MESTRCIANRGHLTSRRGNLVGHVRKELGISEDRACRTPSQHRFTQGKTPQDKADEINLKAHIIELLQLYASLWLSDDIHYL